MSKPGFTNTGHKAITNMRAPRRYVRTPFIKYVLVVMQIYIIIHKNVCCEFASELTENLQRMFPRCDMYSDKYNTFKF